MAYKGKSVVVASASHLVTELKDFLLTCGWTLEGPSTNPAAQDDAEGLILGWFLKSTGEDTAQDIHIHLGVGQKSGNVTFATFDYLIESGGIDAAATDFDVQNGGNFVAGGKYRIENEIFVVGTVAGNTLQGCQRGWGITDPASHAQYKVIQAIDDSNNNAVLYSEIFAFNNFSTALLTSNGNSTGWTAGSANFSGDSVLDNNGYWGNDRFNHHNLIENVTDGKMRWITDYVASTAIFTHQKFLLAPTVASVGKIYSAGFLPGWSRRGTGGSSYARRQLGMWAPFTESTYPWSQTFHQEAGTVVWMYGSKDGVFLVGKWPTIQYEAFYIGNCIPYSSPLTTTLSVGATAGANSLSVNNTDIFTPGQKVRIIAQEVADWLTNEDRSAEAPAGNWPNLDPEEIPSEEVEVLSVGTGVITLNANIKYNYSAGAVIGEDPRPGVRVGNYNGGNVTYAAFKPAASIFVPLYSPVPKDKIAQHASHRQYSRAGHSTQPYTPLWMDGNNLATYSYNSFLAVMDTLMVPASLSVMDFDSATGKGNFQNNQLLMQRYTLEIAFTSPLNFSQYGLFPVGKGILPFCWVNNTEDAPYGGVSEDTVKAMWSGAFETFRYFDVNGTHLIVGPEIA